MPILARLPAEDGQPPAWLLLVRANALDDAAREELEALLEPGGTVRGTLPLDPGSAVARIDLELCDGCPIMKWRALPDGGLQVSLQRVGLKALTELWALSVQGAGDYYFEVLDATAAREPRLTHLTLRLEGASE